MLDVSHWLAEQGFGHYAEAFAKNGSAGDILRELTDADLKELGLNLGDRKRLLKAIATLDAAPTRDGSQPVEQTKTPALRREPERRQLTVMFVRFLEAELWRLRGQLLLVQERSEADEVEVCFRKALAVAREQRARAWELRASRTLARLWAKQGERRKARDLLAPVYGWFTEGLDTIDLKEAKALLDELA